MTDQDRQTWSPEDAGETLGVTVEDLRSYVEEGLVEPDADADGRMRFTRIHMRRLWSIVTLHRDLGINLPGVAAVLRLREQYETVRHDLATLIEIVERELGPDVWDRLWPEGRPRPAPHVSVEHVCDAAPPPDGDPGDGRPEGGPADA